MMLRSAAAGRVTWGSRDLWSAALISWVAADAREPCEQPTRRSDHAPLWVGIIPAKGRGLTNRLTNTAADQASEAIGRLDMYGRRRPMALGVCAHARVCNKHWSFSHSRASLTFSSDLAWELRHRFTDLISEQETGKG